MAVAELLALREQIPAVEDHVEAPYDPQDRSLANTMRALRKCMRNLHKTVTADEEAMSDAYTTARYRQRLAGVLTERALTAAAARAARPEPQPGGGG